MLKFMEHQQRDHAGACGNPLFPVGKQRTSIRCSGVCALCEMITAPKPSRFGGCCVTVFRTRTCSSCACGYLCKIEIRKKVALYFLISITVCPKGALNIKMPSQFVVYNRVDRCKENRGRRNLMVTPSFDANSSLSLFNHRLRCFTFVSSSCRGWPSCVFHGRGCACGCGESWE